MTNINKEEMRQKLGNITQIRELLFGEQIDEYEQKFLKTQQKIANLESNIEDLNRNLERFKTDIKKHLSQLKTTISSEMNSAGDSLEKKLKYLSVNTYAEINKVNQEINTKTQDNFQKIDLLTDKLNSQIKLIQEEATQNREASEKDLKNLKMQLSETITKNLSELSETKVSRSDLAEVLFDLCIKVKGQEGDRNLIEPNSSNNDLDTVNGELLLLEETNPQ